MFLCVLMTQMLVFYPLILTAINDIKLGCWLWRAVIVVLCFVNNNNKTCRQSQTNLDLFYSGPLPLYCNSRSVCGR
jgi:hypothetical protein